MSIIVNRQIDLLLYTPQPNMNEKMPIGEFRGHWALNGDASGGYVQVTFIPADAEQASNFVWLWMNGHSRINSAVAEVVNNMQRLMLSTAEGNFLDGTTLYETTSRYGDSTVDSVMMPFAASLDMIRVPHKPRAGLQNSFTVRSTVNLGAGVSYDFSVWGYVFHPEVRTRAGGLQIPLY